MNAEDFKRFAKECIDYIVDYTENIRERKVLAEVKPGYLREVLPEEAPSTPDDWRQILPDLEKFIMPGVTHWNSPYFNAYYPAGNSYPSIVGEILSAGIGCVGFNWITSPSCTELEVIVLDWLAKMMGLPSHFIASNGTPGGGVIQQSGSESILIAMLVAKDKTVKKLKREHPSWCEGTIMAKLVAYSSEQSNSAIEKAGKLASMRTRLLECEDDGTLRGETLMKAIQQDKAQGLIPCCVLATLGTTATCAFDHLDEIGPICGKEQVWLHVDAAYAGAAFICPEYRHYMSGIEYADSFNMNPHKWLLVNFDCSAFWIKDRKYLLDAFSVDRIYLKKTHEQHENYAPDFRNWEIPLGRRFRSLKLWLTLRLYGVSGLQEFVRGHCRLAQHFASLVQSHPRFTLVRPPAMALVCFKIKDDEKLTKELLEKLTGEGNVFMVAGTLRGEYFLRYSVNSRLTQESDVDNAWFIIRSAFERLIRQNQNNNNNIQYEQSVNTKPTNYKEKQFNQRETLLHSKHG